MTASTYDVGEIPAERRAIGYRWQDDAWLEEPALGPGTFGAMGGLAVSANDYAKYVAWVLQAWPARDGPEHPVLKRSSIREIIQGENFPGIQRRMDAAEPCDRARAYGLGMIVFADCELGLTITHSGGLPGYGSNVVMLPERGVGVFAFANLTYAPTAAPVRAASLELVKSGAFPARATPTSPALRQAAGAVARIYAAGDVLAARDGLAMNFLLDRDAAHWKAEIAPLKEKLGACRAAEPIVTDTTMSANLVFPCERGKLQAYVLLAPTTPATIQALRLRAAP
jgi:CubicO group peptidase (beta-lactamase class C family)